MTKKTSNSIRIGGASGYWGDNNMSTAQLLSAGVDYLVYDYLAEITMSIMARARAKDAAKGYAADFVSAVLKPNLKEISEKGVKVISNAGGVNPVACGEAIRTLIKAQNLSLTVAVVTGDDLQSEINDLAASGVREMFSGVAFPKPEDTLSVNAYIGAFPVAQALNGGADIVITGRSVDSAVTVGACISAFGWTENDLDLLAAGSLAGHLIECGPQATGGNFTDWREVADSLENIGYPIAEITSEGEITIGKPENTGGMVSVGTVAEQLLYEIGDPQKYILPDVVCDFSRVKITQQATDFVHVSGAVGSHPTGTYKVCATYLDGYRGTMVMNFYGAEAVEKAQVFADVAFARSEAKLRASNMGKYSEKNIEILGAESQYGAEAQAWDVREVALKIACKHPLEMGINLLFEEVSGMGLSGPPGLSGFGGGRPRPTPVVRLFSFLYPKEKVAIFIDTKCDSQNRDSVTQGKPSAVPQNNEPSAPDLSGDFCELPLIKLAWGRSGDKGDKSNIGIIARKAEYLPYIWAALSCEGVKSRFAHFLKGDVERFYLPGTNAINFLLHDVLGGGGVASLRADPQGKGYAQLLLAAPIPVPVELARSL